jgi:hypothetical protein
MKSWKVLVFAATAPLAVGCAPAEMSAPRSPAHEVPDVGSRLAPPPTGRQWVVLDTPEDSAQVATVSQVTGTTPRGYAVTGEAAHNLCTTPCVVDLRPGAHTLLFTTADPSRTDHLDIVVENAPLVVRHVIERTEGRSNTGTVLAALGGAAIFGGGLLALIGSEAENAHGSTTGPGLKNAGLGVLVTGGVFLVGGLVLSYFVRGRHTPAATSQWNLVSAGPGPMGAPGAP